MDEDTKMILSNYQPSGRGKIFLELLGKITAFLLNTSEIWDIERSIKYKGSYDLSILDLWTYWMLNYASDITYEKSKRLVKKYKNKS